MSLRATLYGQLDLDAWSGAGVSPLNRAALGLVVISILLAALETEPTLAWMGGYFSALNFAFAILFTLEYLARFWVKWENPIYRGRVRPVLYLFKWYSLIDLAALAAIWFELAYGYGLGWAVMLRLARILRIFSLTRDSDVGRAVRELASAMNARRMELFLSGVMAMLLLMLSSVALYLLEREAQPEAFGSIPRAMWWAMATLTTVGYGDVVPSTGLGKLVAAISAISSIAIVALPAGIMAAAFSEAFQRARRGRKAKGPDA